MSLLSLLAVAIVLITTLRLPIADIKVSRYDNDRVILYGGGSSVVLPRDTPLVLHQSNGASSRLRVDTLIDGIGAKGSAAEQQAWWTQREEIADALRSGQVRLRFNDGRTLSASLRPRRIDDLTGGFWAAIATGFAALLCGMWILVLRPRNSAARTFAVMSLGLFGAGCTLAAGYDPLLLGQSYRWLMLLNHACAQLFAAAILMLFCRFPTPLIGRYWTWLIGLAIAMVPLTDAFALSRDAIQLLFLAIAAEFVLLVILLIAQAWAVRSNPVGLAAMRLIGSSAVLSSTLFVGTVILPMLLLGAPLVSEAVALPLLLVIYAGLAAAIARTRLFSVDGWAPGLLLSVGAALAVAAADVVILSIAAGSHGSLLPIAIAAVGLIYLPFRIALSRRADRRRDASARRSLGLASEVAFALDAQSRMARWQAGLTAMFEALEVRPGEAAVSEPRIAEEGIALHLPAVGGIPGVALRYAQRGARDFDAIDLEQAQGLINAVGALIEARDAYVRGVAKERARIAQDLHDDVSARLLTSLHRRDARMMRRDVREAMADIRAIVASTGETWRPLDEVLADMRFEAMSRLEAHNVALIWPMADAGVSSRLLDYSAARHLTSIVRELISNIARHSGASCVEVEVSVDGDRLKLRFSDDGIGIDAGASWGNGLSNCARRAALLEGVFHIHSSAAGTIASLEAKLTNQGLESLTEKR